LPTIVLPEERGKITVLNVLEAASGQERDNMIKRWCETVWEAYSENRSAVISLVDHYGI